MSREHQVAIVGMACRFPGGDSVAGYWAALRAGRESISRFSPDQLAAAGVDTRISGRPGYVPAMGVIAGGHCFDWSYFRYSRREAAITDPQQRILLETASRAIDDAAIDPARFAGWIGVYAGADQTPTVADESLDPLLRVVGREKDFLATRVAYKLGLRGPAITVQTACSTSLVAVHTAVQSLLNYECDAALAGGVAVWPANRRGYLYKDGGILSPDGRCRPFDADSAGTVPSEGVGIVVLKRLPDAERDRDRILAVIRGSAVNNDGGEKIGYTAPSVSGQREVIRLALNLAGVDPADVDHVEAHGTATRLGDPVEVQALTDVFRESTTEVGQCLLGAVKSNLGHTGAAAGVAGLIKTALMLNAGEVVPTLHYREPNPLLELDKTPFQVVTQVGPWPRRGTPLAGISSFGVGGTNAHLVLGAADSRPARRARPGGRVLVLSADSTAALSRMRTELADQLSDLAAAGTGSGSDSDSDSDATMDDVGWTLATGRRRYPYRQAVVAGDLAGAAQALRTAAGPVAVTGAEPKTAFVFPGQGTLRHPAGAAPHRHLPRFRTGFDEIADGCRRRFDVDLGPVVSEQAPPDWFTDTVHQQLGLFALGYALGRQLEDWGIRPHAMLGNSIGEYVAATLAGVWTVADATGLVHARALAMRAAPAGRMAAVNAPAAQVAPLIAGHHPEVTVAVAGPRHCVLCASVEAMATALRDPALAGLKVRPLDTRHAFHSPAMAAAADQLHATVAGTHCQPHKLTVVSTVTGALATGDELTRPEYWADQLRLPVNLADATTALLAEGCEVFIELGPGASTLAALRGHAGWQPSHQAVPLLGDAGTATDPTPLLTALGRLWSGGLPVPIENWSRATPAPYRCALPPHPLDSADPAGPAPATGGLAAPGADPDPLRQRLAQQWCRVLGVATVADDDDFFGQGGDSLLVIQLLSELADHTGVQLPVVEFSRQPTFGGLLGLAKQAGAAAGPPDGKVEGPAGLITFTGSGAKAPLFLIADALGNTAGYRALAEVLAGDHPIYGVEPAAPGTSVEELAAHCLDVICRARPEGPYLIGGWSFGAVVAHELTRQLEQSGAQVAALLCLDGHAPDTGGRRIGVSPAFIASRLRLQLAAARGRGAVGALTREEPQLRHRLAASLRAMSRYRPGPVRADTVLLRAERIPLGARLLPRRPPPSRGRIQVRAVPGDHWSMLRQPYVAAVAAVVRQSLSALADSPPALEPTP